MKLCKYYVLQSARTATPAHLYAFRQTAGDDCYGKSAVQCAHFVALIGISDRHLGHSLVVGSDGAGSPPTFFITEPSNFTIVMNTANDTSRKFSNSARKFLR